jgi:hypothetical protein
MQPNSSEPNNAYFATEVQFQDVKVQALVDHFEILPSGSAQLCLIGADPEMLTRSYGITHRASRPKTTCHQSAIQRPYTPLLPRHYLGAAIVICHR